MWGIPSLTLDICSLCQLLEEKRPKSASSAPRPPAATARRRASNTNGSGGGCARPTLAAQKRQQQQQRGLVLDADTIVIGNGPAGIALSALLSGWQPSYDRNNPHPDPQLHAQLLSMADNADADNAQPSSLLGQDIGSLADQHFAHSEVAANAGGHTPFAVLYDCLVRPHLTTTVAGHATAVGNDAEQQQLSGMDNGTLRSPCPRPSPCSSSSASCLCWRRHQSSAVPHIVLGDQQIGGSWTEYDDDMVTVSAAEWMDLPGFAMAADFARDPRLAQQRPRAALYKAYLNAYVDAMGLRHNFRPFTRVTQIEKLCHPLTRECHWRLCGTETDQKTGEKRIFMLQCRHLVLACGRQQPKLLGVPGEQSFANDGRLVYSLNSLKRCLETDEATGGMASATAAAVEVSADRPVVVVGDGISAADAVLHCLSIEQPVLHIVRRTERELRNTQLARLSSTVYPEYARVYRLMTGRTREVNYRRLLGTSVRSIGTATAVPSVSPSSSFPIGAVGVASAVEAGCGALFRPHVVLSSSSSGRHHQQQHQLPKQPFRALAVCIGRRSEVPLLNEYLRNSDDLPTDFTTRYQSGTDPSLFAIGALAGDHFVRFLVGGALCVAQTIIKDCLQHQQQQVQAVHPAADAQLQFSAAYLAKAFFKFFCAAKTMPSNEDDDDGEDGSTPPWHNGDEDEQDNDNCDTNGCRRPRDIGAECAILRTATAGATAASCSPTPLVVSTTAAAAAVERAKQLLLIGRPKSQFQLIKGTTTTTTTKILSPTTAGSAAATTTAAIVATTTVV